ncbi:SAF domain-containing protein [Streptomyces sp. NPDC001793]|uniref:SAF domain-containing protein n=1 Tax=Streptomyces sp. NPDC001793 TaxID=3154657 RepID=UPI00332483D8
MTGGRRRRLGWVWAGLGAVVVSAVGFTMVANVVGHRDRVLMLARDVPAGRVLQPADLRVVEVAAEAGVVPVAGRGTVVGRRVKVPLVAGALLAPGQVGTPVVFPPKGSSQVSLAVEPGAAPPELSRGERVAVLPGPAGGGAPQADGDQASSAVMGTVTGVRAPESSGGPRVVTVLVETGAAKRAAQLEHPRVVVLPAEGREAP